ncbi:DUF4326 domain-containing protein [Nonomuraea sp. NPDC049714]|uniref:DUF4326 domain-containing protein n=1 Tax=Nonomuraea sp. NPDC049714 TaxID=3364357 RepID=UPI00378B2642
MTTPKRVQRKRSKGSKLPEGAVCVDRTTPWGNPFKVGEKVRNDSPLWPYIAAAVPGGARGLVSLTPMTREQAVHLYSCWVVEQPHLMLRLDELAGRDLACWCATPKPGAPDHCHAAYLLELVREACDA